MAPLPPTPSGVVKVRLVHRVSEDQDAESAIYFSYSGAGTTQAGLTSFAAAIAAAWQTNMPPSYPSTVALTSVICLDAQNPSNPEGIWTGNQPGLEANPLTAETAVLINFSIARRYRGGKPRVYIPAGWAGALNDMQTWTTSAISTFTNDWTAFIAQIKTFPGPPLPTNQVSVSYHSGGTWHQNTATGAWKFVPTVRSTPIVDPILGFRINPKPGSQRRRMLR